jgi:tetratricopeptide (TPR) repeat protein
MNMNKATFTVAGIVLAGVIGFTAARRLSPTVPSPESTLPPLQGQPPHSQESEPAATVLATLRAPQAVKHSEPSASVAPQEAPPAATADSKSPQPSVSLVFNQAIETLTSPHAGFPQRQSAWQQLKDAGKLDQAITDLEQRATANPQAPEYPAALGQAFLQKAGTITDLREQGILGMKADQTFDAALQKDPANWDARFWKATAMSYWPTVMGKSQEVVEQFADLIVQQEAQSPQSHFAQTYVRLGEYYQKLGHAEYAQQVWQRGVTLFPEDATLREKAAAAK